MKNRIEFIRNSLIDILTQVEAAIDFPEDVGDLIDVESVNQILNKAVINELSDMVAQYENAHFLRDGLRMIVVGRPNVGKRNNFV